MAHRNIYSDIEIYYAKRIQEYDRIYEKPERQSDLSILKTMVAESFAGLEVLEIACGTGYWTECIAKRATSIVATDINSEILSKASERDYGQCLVDIRYAKASDLSNIKAEYAAGFSGFFWSHIPHHKRCSFIQSFHSRLRDKAVVVLVDNLFVKSSNSPISRMDNDGNTYQIRSISDGSVHEVMKNFPTEYELRNIFNRFTYSIEYIPLKYYWFLRYIVRR